MATPFYEATIDERGHVWLRIDNQTFRLAHEPKEVDAIEGVNGYGEKHGQYLCRQLQTALDKMAFRFQPTGATKQ